ncbi:hypothetical protein SNE40_010666 [Patella caerulea]|uniref:glycerophosphocholine cholinephosphodiesterase n=1 Tax=Patella caerulea TaxID=87958 RepID=A0AAN8Q0I8_PATCE
MAATKGLGVYIWMLITCIKSVIARENQQLLMLLLDGFRWDYLDQPDLHLPGFRRILEIGIRTDYLKPVYPTLSYPNYYSIATGLYTENHGMISNYMYDEVEKESFLIGTNPEQYHSYWWNQAEPVWISAEKQKLNSYMYFWPGCEVTIRDVKPTQCRPYNGPPSLNDFKRVMADVMRKFVNDEADLGGVYYEMTDKLGHDYGPKSKQLNDNIQALDAELFKLTEDMVKMGLNNKLNVMIFSDHGMTDMTNRTLIDTASILTRDDYDVIRENGPLSSLWPKPGKHREVYHKLRRFHRKMHVYERDDLPERYHYKHNARVAPITMIAEKPYYILTPVKPNYPSRKSDFHPRLGVHGYDDTDIDMRGIFLGFGPSFKAHYRGPGIENIHLYQIMCRILGLIPESHNGTWSTISGLVTDKLPPAVGGASTLTVTYLTSMTLLVLICTILGF